MPEMLSREHFQEVYSIREDQWGLTDSEEKTFWQALEILTSKGYEHALKIGCSSAMQTAMLAARCKHLLVIDTEETAIEEAKSHFKFPNVQFMVQALPRQYPEGHFDLTVLFEAGRSFSLPKLITLADQISSHRAARSELLLVHRQLPISGAPLTADEVHNCFLRRVDWRRFAGSLQPHYRIDLLTENQID